MDRRDFFRATLKKGGKTAVKLVDRHLDRKTSSWIRPPFAIPELEFLLACTRCRDCIDACPHQVVFSLPARVGARFAGTPALDLLNKGCHLCADWPCVTACQTGALALPSSEHGQADGQEGLVEASERNPSTSLRSQVKLAQVEIDQQHCLPYNGPECGACLHSCPVPGALFEDYFKPMIDAALCSGCGLCREQCIADPKAITIRSIKSGKNANNPENP